MKHIINYLIVAMTAVTALGAEIKSGETVQGEIATIGAQQAWTFSANAGDVASIRVVKTVGDESNFQPNVKVYDPTGKMVGGSFLPFDVVVRNSGTHTIICDAITGKTTGTYNLSIIIVPASPTTARPSTTDSMNKEGIGTATVISDEAPIQTGTNVIARIKKDAELSVYEVKEEWYRVMPQGWIHGRFVQFHKAPAATK